MRCSLEPRYEGYGFLKYDEGCGFCHLLENLEINIVKC